MNVKDAILTHIISQLTYRSISFGSILEPEDSREVHKISLADWKTYLEKFDLSSMNQKPWAEAFFKKLNGSSSLILKEIETLNRARENGFQYLSICDPLYPYLLRQTQDPPAGISYLGDISLLSRPTIALVGSRKAAEDSIQETQRLATMLADEGASIVSGGAIGIDTAAHLGTLMTQENSAPAIAVMAGSIDKLYPRCNDYLFNRMLKRGGLFLSERLFFTNPRPRDFPVRNRIISGLANRVIVMQASQRSGAMSTANLALRQGRDVMVYDPQRKDIRFSGNLSLIDQGAPWFCSADEYFHMKWE